MVVVVGHIINTDMSLVAKDNKLAPLLSGSLTRAVKAKARYIT